MEAGAAQPFLPIAPTPWRLFGDFLADQKVTRRPQGQEKVAWAIGFFLGVQKEARRRGGEIPPKLYKRTPPPAGGEVPKGYRSEGDCVHFHSRTSGRSCP